MREAQKILELSGFGKDKEGGVDGHTNGNITKQCAGTDYTMLHSPFLVLDSILNLLKIF